MRLYSNPDERRRTCGDGRLVHLDPGRITESDLEALHANRGHRTLEAFAAERLDRRHILAVRRYMPYISECRATGKRIRRVPRDILETVAKLKLVGAKDCVTRREQQERRP